MALTEEDKKWLKEAWEEAAANGAELIVNALDAHAGHLGGIIAESAQMVVDGLISAAYKIKGE